MSIDQKRRRLHIDIFAHKNQRAQALESLLPGQLLTAILEEFQEIDYLSTTADDYALIRTTNQTPLDEETPIGKQLLDDDHLTLVERELPRPPGTQRPSRPVYLREQSSGQVYKLHWVPAIVGRPDPAQPHNERVAVNLEAYHTGLRVSRRHLEIVERGGQFLVRSLSPRNPALVRDHVGNTHLITEEGRPLQSGDLLILERSDLTLRWIEQDEQPRLESTEPAEATVPTPAVI